MKSRSLSSRTVHLQGSRGLLVYGKELVAEALLFLQGGYRRIQEGSFILALHIFSLLGGRLSEVARLVQPECSLVAILDSASHGLDLSALVSIFNVQRQLSLSIQERGIICLQD